MTAPDEAGPEGLGRPVTGPGGRGGGRAGVRRRWAGLPLRTRLVAGLLALAALGFVVVGAVTALALHGFLLQRLDQQLAAAGDRYQHGPGGGGDQGGGGGFGAAGCSSLPPRGQAVGTLVARVVGGQLVCPTIFTDLTATTLPPAPTALDQTALLAITPGAPARTVRLDSVGAYRLRAALDQQDGDVTVIGLPLADVTDTVHRLEVTEALVFGGVLLVLGVVGAGWVRLALRPLRRVAATATAVAGLPLGSGEVDVAGRVPDLSDLADSRTEVGQVGVAFTQMIGHVEASLAQRQASEARLRQFVADASHELRTPLASIRGYAELTRRSPEPVPPDVARAMGRVEAEAGRMGVLVEDLLLLARLDAGRPLEREPVDLARVAADATSDAHAAGPDHTWRLDLPAEPVMVVGDPGRLHQVAVNLLANARVHTPAGTTVTVRVAGPAAGGCPPYATLTVTDDGPGIPAPVLPHVFERFARADASRTRASGGSGLGLAIVEAVAGAHGGQVAVQSQPGETTVTVRLPAATDAPPDPGGDGRGPELPVPAGVSAA